MILSEEEPALDTNKAAFYEYHNNPTITPIHIRRTIIYTVK